GPPYSLTTGSGSASAPPTNKPTKPLSPLILDDLLSTLVPFCNNGGECLVPQYMVFGIPPVDARGILIQDPKQRYYDRLGGIAGNAIALDGKKETAEANMPKTA